MATQSRAVDRFSCTTSRFFLPTFRRPGYRAIRETQVEHDPEDKSFSTWTEEAGQYYQVVNTALLSDDYEALSNNVRFVNSLRNAIRNNDEKQAVKVYRGLTISSDHIRQEYKEGLHFLWPTFTCTSRNRDIAHGFGEYVFEIDVSPDDWTYRADISQYSVYPQEEEVLFYPYSGFIVNKIMHDEKVIQLKCVDTLQVEEIAQQLIRDELKLFDATRNIFVYLYKKTGDAKWCDADKPSEIFIIADNGAGYWDAPYRYHHRNGYFIEKGQNIWEEYQNNELNGTFTRVDGNNHSYTTTSLGT